MAKRASLIKRTPKKTKTTKTQTYFINRKQLGDEPVLEGEPDNLQMTLAMNWYNVMCSSKEAREFLAEYFESVGRPQLIKNLNQVPDVWVPRSAAWVARLIMRGTNVPESAKTYLKNQLLYVFNRFQKPVKVEGEVEKVYSVQDRMKERASEIIGDIEFAIDKEPNFVLYDYLKGKEIPSSYSTNIIEYYTPILDELQIAYTGKDAAVKEGYSKFTKRQLNDLVIKYKAIISDAERYGSVAKKQRVMKPRKAKPVSIDKKLKSVKYQKEDKVFKVVSLSPEKVIGSTELWTFNTKYKKLTVMLATEGSTLDIKGTSIINFDEKTSYTIRTGRKTTEYLDRVVKNGKVALKKLYTEIQKQNPDNDIAYRLNENTILLKIA